MLFIKNVNRIIFLSTFFYCLGSQAEEAGEFRASLSSQITNAHYKELNEENIIIAEEKGDLLASGISIYWKLRSGIFSELKYQRANDTLQYQGETQGSVLVQSIETTTELNQIDWSFLFGRQVGRTAAFVGIANHYRERNVLGYSSHFMGIYEELSSLNGIFGLKGILFSGKNSHIALEGRVWTDLDSEFYVSTTGPYQPITIRPGKQISYRASLEFLFRPFVNVFFSITPAYEFTDIKKSKNYPLTLNGIITANEFHQPAFEWETYSITGSLGLTF